MYHWTIIKNSSDLCDIHTFVKVWLFITWALTVFIFICFLFFSEIRLTLSELVCNFCCFLAGSAVWVCFTVSLLGRLWQAVHYVFLVSDITMSFFIVSTVRASVSISVTMVWWNRSITFWLLVFSFFFFCCNEFI